MFTKDERIKALVQRVSKLEDGLCEVVRNTDSDREWVHNKFSEIELIHTGRSARQNERIKALDSLFNGFAFYTPEKKTCSTCKWSKQKGISLEENYNFKKATGRGMTQNDQLSCYCTKNAPVGEFFPSLQKTDSCGEWDCK